MGLCLSVCDCGGLGIVWIFINKKIWFMLCFLHAIVCILVQIIWLVTFFKPNLILHLILIISLDVKSQTWQFGNQKKKKILHHCKGV
jgi:hypothetical protein